MIYKRIRTCLGMLLIISCGVSQTFAQSSPLLPKLKTQLVPLQKVYKIGEPVLVRVELVNSSFTTYSYYSQDAGVNDSLLVKAPGDRIVPFIGGMIQAIGSVKTIAPNQTVSLVDKLDISSQYYMDTTGWYRIKFKSNEYGNLPESGVLEIELKAGEPKPLDIMVGKIIKILPKDWTLSTFNQKKDFSNQYKIGTDIQVNGFGINIENPNMSALGKSALTVLVTDKFIPLETMQKVPDTIELEFIGHNALGYVYFINPDLASLGQWDEARDKIIKVVSF